MKKIRKNALVLIAITGVVLFFVLKDDFSSILDTILKANVLWLIASCVCIILYWIFKSLGIHIIIKEYAKGFSFKYSFSHTMITQFFNGITPFSTGGQPMEVYMLKQHGIRVTKGTTIVMQNFVFYQIALVLFGIIAVSLNAFLHLFPYNSFLSHLILLGFTINTIIAIAIIVISVARKFSLFLAHKVIHFGHKLKIIKNIEQTMISWDEKIEDFHESSAILRKNKKLMILGISYNFLSLTFFYGLPLLIAYSFNDYHSLNIINTIVASAYVLIVGSFVPIPGASGGIEYGFMTFFGNFITGSRLSALLLLWRFLTYYLGMIIGAVMLSFDKGEIKE